MQVYLRQAFALQVVAPKRAAQADANKRLDGANKKLTGIRAKVKELKDRVASLEDSLMKVSPPFSNPPSFAVTLWSHLIATACHLVIDNPAAQYLPLTVCWGDS